MNDTQKTVLMSSKKAPGRKSSQITYSEGQGFQTILDRMMRALGVSTQTELAAVLDVGKAAVSDAKRRKIIPPEWYLKLSRPPHCINPAWLETGQGSQSIDPDWKEAPGDYGLKGQGFELVPLVRAKPSANGAGLDFDQSVDGHYAFRREWLERKGEARSMRLLRVTGDSMLPTLRDEDVVLVDESQRDVQDGKIYAIRMDDDVVVKRLGKKPGKLSLISDNRDLYPSLDVDINDKGSVAILGRVVWMAREVM